MRSVVLRTTPRPGATPAPSSPTVSPARSPPGPTRRDRPPGSPPRQARSGEGEDDLGAGLVRGAAHRDAAAELAGHERPHDLQAQAVAAGRVEPFGQSLTVVPHPDDEVVPGPLGDQLDRAGLAVAEG